jgi:hypothetical protein
MRGEHLRLDYRGGLFVNGLCTCSKDFMDADADGAASSVLIPTAVSKSSLDGVLTGEGESSEAIRGGFRVEPSQFRTRPKRPATKRRVARRADVAAYAPN